MFRRRADFKEQQKFSQNLAAVRSMIVSMLDNKQAPRPHYGFNEAGALITHVVSSEHAGRSACCQAYIVQKKTITCFRT